MIDKTIRQSRRAVCGGKRGGGGSGSPKRGEPSNCGWRFAPFLPRVARLIEHRRLPWADIFRAFSAINGI
ncbi:MAG: hypothetical protein LBP75_11315 [Planctomycetota bacterium]|nr:hypothetical protein [Planctomycetota bacterium]